MDPKETYTPMKEPKYCFVPACKNNSRDTQKVFFAVPSSAKQEWCNAVGISCPKRVIYVCEDHLNLEEDVENYRYWITMKVRPKLKSRLPQSLVKIPLSTNHQKMIESSPSSSSTTYSSFIQINMDVDTLSKPETSAPVAPERPPTPPPTLFCIGCLQKEVPLISLLTCSHAEFITSLMVPEIKPNDQLICYQCHEMLKKIKLFKLQVEESFKLLSDSSTAITPQCSNRKLNLTIHQTFNLEIPQTSSTDNLETIDNTEKSLAPKRSQNKAKKSKNIKEALKIINDVGNEEIYPPIIEKKHSIDVSDSNMQIDATDAPFGSNVIQLTLTKQELIQERAKAASSPGYLHTRYRCKSCLIGFQFKENLTDHVKRKHKPRNKQFLLKCRVCRQLVRRDLYDQHTFCHYNRFKCRPCGQQFGSYDNAALHYTKQHTKSDLTELNCPQSPYKTCK